MVNRDRKNAGTKEILKGINLTINRGEIHVIMGPNGSGKTTTANAILNNPIYKKENGSIYFNGEDISSASYLEQIEFNQFHTKRTVIKTDLSKINPQYFMRLIIRNS